jgi:hypothetical protein
VEPKRSRIFSREIKPVTSIRKKTAIHIAFWLYQRLRDFDISISACLTIGEKTMAILIFLYGHFVGETWEENSPMVLVFRHPFFFRETPLGLI